MTLKLEQRKQALFHIMAWLILIFIISNAVIIETGELSLNVFYKVTFGMAIFYLNYSFLVPRLLLNNHKLAYFFCVMLTDCMFKVFNSKLYSQTLLLYLQLNRIAPLVFFPNYKHCFRSSYSNISTMEY